MFKLRRIIIVLIIGTIVWFAGPMLLKGMVLGRVHQTFAKFGFPDPRYDVVEFSWGALKLANVQLEPEGISTIDAIDAAFTPWGLLRGQALHIVVTHPDIIQDMTEGGLDGLRALPSLLTRFSLQNIPAETLSVTDLSVTFAGDDLSPSVQGKINLLTDSTGTRKLSLYFDSEQKDMSVQATGQMTEDRAGNQKLTLEIPEARFDVPGLRLSRANGKLKFSRERGGPLAIEGELAAGALKIGMLPLENLTLVASGQKPELNVLGNATATGIPLTNVSLRLAEDAKGASMLIQLSGESPKGLIEQIFPGTLSTLPDQQKYAIAINVGAGDFFGLFTPPYKGGLFFYLADPQPLLSAALTCTDLSPDCKVTLPATSLDMSQFSALFGRKLTDQGLTLGQGTIRISGTGQSHKLKSNGKILLETTFETNGTDVYGDWRGIKFSQARFETRQQGNGAFTLSRAQAKTLGGEVLITDLQTNAAGKGACEMQFKNIDLQPVQKVMAVPGLKISGRVDATLKLTFGGNPPTIDAGSSLRARTGHVAYTPSTYPPFLSGAEERLQILRDALKDYIFENITVTVNDFRAGEIIGKLSATGKNTALFGDRSVILDLDIKTAPTAAFLRMIPDFAPAAR